MIKASAEERPESESSDRDFSYAPAIKISSEDIEHDSVFMVDTGAAPNLREKGKLELHVKINETHTFLLSGITDGQVKTIGSVCTKLFGRPITLHVSAVFQYLKTEFWAQSFYRAQEK